MNSGIRRRRTGVGQRTGFHWQSFDLFSNFFGAVREVFRSEWEGMTQRPRGWCMALASSPWGI